MRRARVDHAYPGQGLVEFALVLPVFLLLTLGIVEMGWLLYTNHTLTNATREGARYAMVHGDRSGDLATVSDVQAVVQDHSGALSSSVTVQNVDFEPDALPGSEVTVETTYDYQPIVGVIVGVSPFQLSGETTVIVQY